VEEKTMTDNDKKKQIEEMAKISCYVCEFGHGFNGDCDLGKDEPCAIALEARPSAATATAPPRKVLRSIDPPYAPLAVVVVIPPDRRPDLPNRIVRGRD
jgi:hypothetical protein